MDRRELLMTMGVLSLGSATVFAKDETKVTKQSAGKNPHLDALIKASSECMQTGEICLSHCMRSLNDGDKSMAECNATVHNMLAICSATMKVAAYQTSKPDMLKQLVQTCADYCQQCATACEKHAGHHAECNACMESCKKCADVCKKFIQAA
jgi:Cys-rich four helix bundle protein (predicted Tat secretion target)